MTRRKTDLLAPVAARRHPAALALLLASLTIGTGAQAQVPTASAECVPACRGGFVCVQGQCVSACNPACPGGQVCGPNAQCAPPPAYPPAASAAWPAAAGYPTGYATAPGYAPAGYPPQGAYYAPAYPPPEPPPVRGRHLHDGFFMRLGSGAAYGAFAFSDSSLGDKTVNGGGMAVDFTIGGAVRPGIILAGSMHPAMYPAPRVKNADGTSAVATNETLSVFGVGAQIDYYPDAEKGLHFGADLGVGGASVQNRKTGHSSDNNPVGIAAAAHVGYEIWISDQWSFGGMFRAAYVHASREASTTTNGNSTTTWSALTLSGFQPSLVANFTFN